MNKTLQLWKVCRDFIEQNDLTKERIRGSHIDEIVFDDDVVAFIARLQELVELPKDDADRLPYGMVG